MDSDTLHRAVTRAREGPFGDRKGAVVTVTDIIVTFPEGTKLRATATVEVKPDHISPRPAQSQPPQGRLPGYRSGPQDPGHTDSLRKANTALPFTRQGLSVQLYQQEGDWVKYTDTLGSTVTLSRQSKTPSPPKQWAPWGFCPGSAHEESKCFKKNQRILGLSDPEAQAMDGEKSTRQTRHPESTTNGGTIKPGVPQQPGL